MAGKKGRKKQKVKKKAPKDNITETSASVDAKKPKLNDELKKRDEQSVDKREPSLETVAHTNDDKLLDSHGDLQGEDSKYVPPFSRKVKRALKRSGSPVSPAGKPIKRSWRGKQNSKAQPVLELSTFDDIQDKQIDLVCTEDSAKIEKEEKKEEEEEEEIDIMGIEKQITCSQEDEEYVPHSANRTTGQDAKGGVILSSALSTAQEELSIVKHVFDSVLDAVCKMDHYNNDKSMAEFEKDLNEFRDGKDIHSHTNNDTNKGDGEVVFATENPLGTFVDTVIEITSF